MFGAQYFFELFNKTSNKTEGHAATGELFNAKQGEILWTNFSLNDKWEWTLGMGIKGDPSRTSTVVAPKPYMGLLPPTETNSWSEDTYNQTFVNGCWEMYGVEDREHYPSTGSTYLFQVLP